MALYWISGPQLSLSFTIEEGKGEEGKMAATKKRKGGVVGRRVGGWNAQPDFVETTQGVVQGKYEKGRRKEGREKRKGRIVSRSRASLTGDPGEEL